MAVKSEYFFIFFKKNYNDHAAVMEWGGGAEHRDHCRRSRKKRGIYYRGMEIQPAFLSKGHYSTLHFYLRFSCKRTLHFSPRFL